MTEQKRKLSVVIPIFNEESNISPLYEDLISVIKEINYKYEIIFVDDGSTDNSIIKIKGLIRKDKNISLIKLSKNFGHQIAIAAGMNYAKGDAAIFMDADLQHPPKLINKMVKNWEEGYDVVYTIRKNHGINIFKRLTAKCFYALINLISETKIIPNAADFRLLDKKVYSQLNRLKENPPFMRGLVQWVGFKSHAIPYIPVKRKFGKTKYSFKKMLALGTDGILSFSTAPLRAVSCLGLLAVSFCFVYFIYIVVQKYIYHSPIAGWTSLILTVLFIGSVQLISIGFIGEYISRIHNEVKNRPLYIVDEIIGGEIEK